MAVTSTRQAGKPVKPKLANPAPAPRTTTKAQTQAQIKAQIEEKLERPKPVPEAPVPADAEDTDKSLDHFKSNLKLLKADRNPAVKIPKISKIPRPIVEIPVLEAKILLDRTNVPFTIQLAWDYINLPTFDEERDPIVAHLDTLNREAAWGNFNFADGCLVRARYQGRWIKIDGQHRSWMRLTLPRDLPGLRIREIHYEVTSFEQLTKLYASFDRGKPRTDVHCTLVGLARTAAVKNLSKMTEGKCIAGFKFWQLQREYKRTKVSHNEISTMIKTTHSALFNKVGQFIDGIGENDARHCASRQPVVGAIFETTAKHPDESFEFWSAVLKGTNLAEGDPRRLLNRYLYSNVLRRVSPKGVESEDMYRAGVHVWNKWWEEEAITVIRVPKERPTAL